MTAMQSVCCWLRWGIIATIPPKSNRRKPALLRCSVVQGPALGGKRLCGRQAVPGHRHAVLQAGGRCTPACCAWWRGSLAQSPRGGGRRRTSGRPSSPTAGSCGWFWQRDIVAGNIKHITPPFERWGGCSENTSTGKVKQASDADIGILPASPIACNKPPFRFSGTEFF